MPPRFSLPALAFPAAPASRLSRCFATTADGRIPLTLDWPRLFHALAQVPQVAFQTRTHRARLIGLGPFPVGDPAAGAFHRPDCRLCFHYTQWADAWARLELCPCCQSPGRIEVSNTMNTVFMEICAPAQGEPADWANLLSSLAERAPTDLSPSPSTSRNRQPLPQLNDISRPLNVQSGVLEPLFEAFGAAAQPITVCLHSAEAFHHRVLVPSEVNDDGQLLTTGDRRSTLQLAHLGTARLHAESTTRGTWLHLTDGTEAILLTLGPGDAHGPARAAWDKTLFRFFNL